MTGYNEVHNLSDCGRFDLSDHRMGSLSHVPLDQQQRACRTVLHNAEDCSDAVEMLEMLGIWPDRGCQQSLKGAR
jgi:hypothetical protein